MLRDATLNILCLKTNSHHTDKRQTTDKQVGRRVYDFIKNNCLFTLPQQTPSIAD